jgi:hypothetical protein
MYHYLRCAINAPYVLVFEFCSLRAVHLNVMRPLRIEDGIYAQCARCCCTVAVLHLCCVALLLDLTGFTSVRPLCLCQHDSSPLVA